MTTTTHPFQIESFYGWMRSGERGISSNTIVERLTGVPVGSQFGGGYPHDPADFRRCELLLREVPAARLGLSLMADVGPEWALFVEHWDELVALGESEVPGCFERRGKPGSAPKMFARMTALREQARSSSSKEES